jgi:hypothetical protein
VIEGFVKRRTQAAIIFAVRIFLPINRLSNIINYFHSCLVPSCLKSMGFQDLPRSRIVPGRITVASRWTRRRIKNSAFYSKGLPDNMVVSRGITVASGWTRRQIRKNTAVYCKISLLVWIYIYIGSP